MKLAEFTSKTANVLIFRVKPSDRPVGRPKKRLSKDRTEQRSKMPKRVASEDDVRFDEIRHCPQRVQKKEAGTEHPRWQAVLSV